MAFAQGTIAGKIADIIEMGESHIVVLLTNETIEIPMMINVRGKMAVKISTAFKDEAKKDKMYGIFAGKLRVEERMVQMQSRSVVPVHAPISFSNVTIAGNLGREVEVIEGKTNFMKNSVAVNEKIEKEKVTHWFNFVAFAKTAEIIAKFLNKGEKIAIHGELAASEYTKKDGTVGQSFEMKAYSFDFLPGSKKDSNDSGSTSSYYKEANPSAATAPIDSIAF